MLNSVIGKFLSMLGSMGYVNLSFQLNFVKPKYRLSIFSDTLMSELRCAVNIKYTVDLKNYI